MFRVLVRKSVLKSVARMPKKEAGLFDLLLSDIANKGPAVSNWSNYGILKGTSTYHCHLSHKWVACWIETEQGIEVEVIYAGSREGAPYAKH